MRPGASLHLGSQVVYSLGSALLVLAVSNATTTRAFASFAVAFTVGNLGGAVARALGAEALALERRTDDVWASMRGALVAAAVSSAVCAAALGVIEGGTADWRIWTLPTLAACMAFADGPRNLLLVSGQPGRALRFDAVWITAVVGAWALGVDAEVLVLAYAAGPIAATLVSVTIPAGRAQHTPSGPSTAVALVVDNLMSLAPLPVLMIVAATAGQLEAVGQFRLLQTAVGPLAVVLSASRMALLSAGLHDGTDVRRVMRKLVVAATAVLGVIGATLLAVPQDRLVAVLGAGWASDRGLTAAFIAHRATTVPYFFLQIALRLHGRTSRLARLSTGVAIATLVPGLLTLAGASLTSVIAVAGAGVATLQVAERATRKETSAEVERA